MSVTYSIAYAAKMVGVSRPTLDSWIARGGVRMTGCINGKKPAFTPADILELRRFAERRREVMAAVRDWST